MHRSRLDISLGTEIYEEIKGFYSPEKSDRSTECNSPEKTWEVQHGSPSKRILFLDHLLGPVVGLLRQGVQELQGQRSHNGSTFQRSRGDELSWTKSRISSNVVWPNNNFWLFVPTLYCLSLTYMYLYSVCDSLLVQKKCENAQTRPTKYKICQSQLFSKF